MRNFFFPILLSALILTGCKDSTVNPDGPEQPAPEIFYTRISADGETITIMGAGADGTGKRTIVQDAALFSAPTQGRIACIKMFGDDGLPVLCDLNGNQINIITTTSRGSYPVLSPAGDKVSYGRRNPDELHMVNADGSNDMTIDVSMADDLIGVWSPDGDRLAYVKAAESDWSDPDSLFVVDADGTNRRLLAVQHIPIWDNVCSFDWSPDGSRIACMVEVFDDVYEIFTVDAGSGAVQQITNDGTAKFMPVWSPDGSRIAVVGFEGSGDEPARSYVMLIEADGGIIQDFTASPTHLVAYPQWSPDGRKIAVTELNGAGNDPQFGTLKILSIADGSLTVVEASAYKAFWKK